MGLCYKSLASNGLPECTELECFLELVAEASFNVSTTNIELKFADNYAAKSGTDLYGGQLDSCVMFLGGRAKDYNDHIIRGEFSTNPLEILKSISTVHVHDHDDDNVISRIASEPFHVCFCENGVPNCTLDLSVETVTGKEISFSVVTVGQGNFTVPSSVRVSLDTNVQLDPVQNIQGTRNTCTNIKYRFFSSKQMISLSLYPDGPCRDIGIARREVVVTFLPCPDGFMLSGSECTCEERLQVYNVNCSVDDDLFERSHNNFWMKALYNDTAYKGLILHKRGCPFEFCIDTPVRFTLDQLDTQCDHNRSGTLCGVCKKNFSLVLGSMHCIRCSNTYLALILPFAAAGIALVTFLLFLRLTVTHGTLSGLIFYANVVQTNQQIFFPPGETNVLTTFIAWLNLCLLYTSPSPRDATLSRMPSSA